MLFNFVIDLYVVPSVLNSVQFRYCDFVQLFCYVLTVLLVEVQHHYLDNDIVVL